MGISTTAVVEVEVVGLSEMDGEVKVGGGSRRTATCCAAPPTVKMVVWNGAIATPPTSHTVTGVAPA